MISALRHEEHQVIFCDTASSDYNENYLSTFDLIMDHRNSNEARKGNPIRKSFDKGIPVLAGSPIYAGSGQGAAVRSLGISKDITYDISDMHRIIIIQMLFQVITMAISQSMTGRYMVFAGAFIIYIMIPEHQRI